MTVKHESLFIRIRRQLPPLNFREFQAFLYGPKVLANSFPKSGTHLLTRVLSLLPLLVPHWTYHVSPKTPQLSQKLSKVRKGQYISGHLCWDRTLAGLLDVSNIRTLLIIRDLRDIAVSNAYYITYISSNHRLSPYFNSLNSDDERLMASIVGVDGRYLADGKRSKCLGEMAMTYTPWFDEPGCLTLRFEDLIGNAGDGSDKKQLETVRTIAHHLGLDLTENQLGQVARRVFHTGAPTFRKGQIGDWRNHFTDEHKRAFKETSGEALIRWGYANGYDW